MKVIIAGSRGIEDHEIVFQAIRQSGFKITEVVCGMARGVDRAGAAWARANDVPVKAFYAMWRTKDGEFDRSAGMARNEAMAEYADALIAVWDGFSPGTKDMMRRMGRRAKPIYYIDLSL